ncbi:SIR2 family protein [Desulfovibrio cuneatus]|uniref:SIR2 family protein n=1 Tax=Desulfovibrio cuneatus TaxID=159728 RepID=UPI0003FFA2ED|nr:SIR2 family protein [Desulfovibrio cuneatus]
MLPSNELKTRLQRFFSDGLVVVIGSGLSCAEGLPSMGDLAKALITLVPKKCSSADLPQWQEIEKFLRAKKGLEEAVNSIQLSESLGKVIVEIVANTVRTAEESVISQCIGNGRILKISSLLSHLSPKHPKKIQIITTNYDRLIEIACEMRGFWLDTGFCGKTSGLFDPAKSKFQGAIGTGSSKKQTPKLIYPNMVHLSKPHGSLDWYLLKDGMPIYTPLCSFSCPLIITPGQHKYRQGYDQPFDAHRNMGNAAIDSAKSFLFIGYGFNDDHLQTHLSQRLRSGIPALILSRSLTESADKIIGLSETIVALSQSSNPEDTTVTMKNAKWDIQDNSWWDVEHFVSGVIAP